MRSQAIHESASLARTPQPSPFPNWLRGLLCRHRGEGQGSAPAVDVVDLWRQQAPLPSALWPCSYQLQRCFSHLVMKHRWAPANVWLGGSERKRLTAASLSLWPLTSQDAALPLPELGNTPKAVDYTGAGGAFLQTPGFGAVILLPGLAMSKGMSYHWRLSCRWAFPAARAERRGCGPTARAPVRGHPWPGPRSQPPSVPPKCEQSSVSKSQIRWLQNLKRPPSNAHL